jgi:hypothetical protein
VVQVARRALENCEDDAYLQFNALILLDTLFQSILPVANFHNEILKGQNANNPPPSRAEVPDIEFVEINENFPDVRFSQLTLV